MLAIHTCLSPFDFYFWHIWMLLFNQHPISAEMLHIFCSFYTASAMILDQRGQIGCDSTNALVVHFAIARIFTEDLKHMPHL